MRPDTWIRKRRPRAVFYAPLQSPPAQR